ncbi:outer membrane lipoprotein-sorting protein [Desulfoluna sp.]|uniref:outer membrane lipoprotein-sorting protein n=1 Tax=Desulfoluna sp. TaxID=2045199 RepID=UPI0026037F7D|nr:outer membrane lipoprotein-sorting protein [Desulfoluna sp.]
MNRLSARQLTIALSILLIGILLPLSWVHADDMSGRDIMVRVNDRPDGDDRIAELSMVLINRRGRERVRQVISWRKDDGKDARKLMRFKKPADVAGTAFLSWDYDDPDKDDDRWLYMPALRNTRRISGDATNDYFMGTDFTYDDMGDRNVDEDTHRLLREESLGKTPCWVVESVPVDPTDMYTKKINWIDTEKYLPLKTDYYDKDGHLKTYAVDTVKNIEGIWTVTAMHMENHVEHHKTLMTFREVRYDTGLKESQFKVNALSRGLRR